MAISLDSMPGCSDGKTVYIEGAGFPLDKTSECLKIKV
jgi:hypothetical protein